MFSEQDAEQNQLLAITLLIICNSDYRAVKHEYLIILTIHTTWLLTCVHASVAQLVERSV